MKNAETVVCQIVARDIPPRMCVELQQSHEPSDCFGCGAHSRICARCRAQHLVVPEIDLCGACLNSVLLLEQPADRAALELQTDTLVYCQIVQHSVRVPMCLASQEPEGCCQCPSPYRFCERCAARTVHYPQYGLCLHCAVAAYAPDWTPETRDQTAEIREERTCPVVSPVSPSPKRKEPSMVSEVIARQRVYRPEQDGELLERARTFVIERQQASARLFQREFNISLERGGRVLAKLEEEGVLGAPTKGFYSARPVLVPAPGVAAETESAPTNASRIKKPARGRRRGGSTLPDELYERAKVILLHEGRATYNLLEKELHVAWYRIAPIIRRFEQEGLVGPVRPGKAREVFLPPGSPPPVTKRAETPPPGIRQRLEQLQERLQELVRDVQALRTEVNGSFDKLFKVFS